MDIVDNRIFVRGIYVLFLKVVHKLLTENVDKNVVNGDSSGDIMMISWVYSGLY